VLVALSIHSHHTEDMVLAEDKAVQIDDQQLQLVKAPGRQVQLTGSSKGQFHRESVIMRIRRNSA